MVEARAGGDSTPCRRPRAMAGTSTLEFAIALPLLLAVLMGIVQVALLRHAQNVLLASVQEGARVAAAEGRPVRDGVAHARSILRSGMGDAGSRVRVSGSASGSEVAIMASGPYRLIIPWTNNSTVTLRARASMSRERFRPQGREP